MRVTLRAARTATNPLGVILGVLYLYSIIFILSHEIVVSLYVVSSHFIYGLRDFLMMLLELY